MPNIKVFSTPTCAYCETLKEYLKANKFSFKDIDVSIDEKAIDEIIKKTGQMGVPVVEIDNEIIIGFDKKRINELLSIKE